MTRLLCLIGSGETAPTMVSLHAELMTRVGSPPAPAVMVDTPYGFQENAGEISARTRAYFRVNVGHPLEVASLRDRETADPLGLERLYNQLRQAHYIFAGPGSPSYALRQWRGTQVSELIGNRLAQDACVTFASAAAVALGRLALPVYEIYKVGEPAHWIEGLDLLAPLGLDFVVIPHYDNAEGGTHDTRYCYMGERRLLQLERQLPGGLGILGVAEHTAAIIDLDARTLEVRGRGFVAVRHDGAERRFEPGPPIDLDQLLISSSPSVVLSPSHRVGENRGRGALAPTQNPLLELAATRRREFDSALERSDIDSALGALLDLDEQLLRWIGDSDSDALEQARSIYRGMLVQLGEASHRGAADPHDLVGPFVELALRLRDQLRRDRRYTDADLVRRALAELSVEVRDTPSGTEWSLTPSN